MPVDFSFSVAPFCVTIAVFGNFRSSADWQSAVLPVATGEPLAGPCVRYTCRLPNADTARLTSHSKCYEL